MAVNTADPCQVVDTLVAVQFEILKRINKKFSALRSLASLLEQLGDVEELIPNIGRLIPVVRIDLAFYENMVAQCPFLNLPPVTSGDLNQLQAMVTGAYANMINRLLRHPWNGMGQLQDQLDDFLGQIQGDVNSAMTQTNDFLRCLQTVCAAGKAVAGQLNAMNDATIAGEITKFAENFAADGGRVMTEGMVTKNKQLNDTILALEALGGDVGMDYADAKAALGP